MKIEINTWWKKLLKAIKHASILATLVSLWTAFVFLDNLLSLKEEPFLAIFIWGIMFFIGLLQYYTAIAEQEFMGIKEQ